MLVLTSCRGSLNADVRQKNMKILITFLLVFQAIANTQAQDALEKGHGVTPDGWVNIYVGNPNLAGVLITQDPAEKKKKAQFKDKHPFVISFVLWDGSINETYYTPEGKIVSASWWRLKDMKGYDPQLVWQYVDYSFGSDPKFKTHKDPRNKSWIPPVCRMPLPPAKN